MTSPRTNSYASTKQYSSFSSRLTLLLVLQFNSFFDPCDFVIHCFLGIELRKEAMVAISNDIQFFVTRWSFANLEELLAPCHGDPIIVGTVVDVKGHTKCGEDFLGAFQGTEKAYSSSQAEWNSAPRETMAFCLIILFWLVKFPDSIRRDGMRHEKRRPEREEWCKYES